MPVNEPKDQIIKKLARNAFWLFLQLGVTRFSSFLITILLVRRLTQDVYGQFSYTISLIGMFLILSDIGLTSLLLREASRKRESTSVIFAQTLLVKAPMMAAAFLLFGVFVLATAGAGAQAALLLAAAAFTESLARFLSVTFNANEKMHKLLIGDAIHKGLLVLLLWAVLRAEPDLLTVGLIYAAAAASLLLYYAVSFYRAFAWPQQPLGGRSFGGHAASLLAASAPMALGGLIMAAYVNTDILLLKWLKGAEATAIYAASYNFYLGIAAVSSFVVQAVVPRLSASIEAQDSVNTEFLLRGTVKLVCILALPLAVGGFLLAPDILSFFYGNAYTGGETAFRVFMCTAPVNFLNLLFCYYMFSSRLQGEINKIYAAAIVLNILLNLLLIPRFGAAGAAAATFAAEALFMGVFLFKHSLFLAFFEASWMLRLLPALTALALYAGFMPHGVNLIARILLGAVIYCGVLAATGALAGEVKLIQLLFKKVTVNAETNIAG